MGLGDLFSKEGRAKRSLEKNLARAVNKLAQSPDRWKALEELSQVGSDEALVGMLKRFDITYDKSIEDEQEKSWVYETMIGKGAAGVPACRQFLKLAASYSWPLRILEDVADDEELLAVLDDLIAKHPPGYERDPSRKIQVVMWIAELKNLSSLKAAQRLVPYLVDVDEGVRFHAVSGLKSHRDEVAREPLLNRFVDPAEESLRVRIRTLEVFAEAGWDVSGYRPKVEALLPDQFLLDAKGHVKKK